jgi:hypothetical protein
MRQIKSLGYLDDERLVLLPSRYWAAHEFCFRLHDQMAELLVQYEGSGAHRWISDALQKMIDETPGSSDEIDLLSLLRKTDLQGPYKHHVVSHLVLALTSDLLHFIYEALSCFEKRKFSVGFSLLRKPFKENLLFLAWILGDTDDFIARFESNNSKTLGGTLEAQRLDIFDKAIKRLPTSEAFSPELIHELIFSKTNADGFEPVWQRASHLVTSQGALLKTDDYEINFIFNDPASDHLYEILYRRLPYVMLFAMQVVLEAFALVLKANEKTVNHLMISTMGCYESLFLSGSKQHIASLVNKSFKSFLKCIHCKEPFRINRKNAPSVYLHEVVLCTKCGLNSDFPLYWLLAMGDTKIDRAEPLAPLLGL